MINLTILILKLSISHCSDGDVPRYTYYEVYTRVIFYVRRIGLYLYKYRNYGTKSIYI